MSRIYENALDKEKNRIEENEKDFIQTTYNDLKKDLRLSSRGYVKLQEFKEAMSK